jgi:Flp pilus assembly protein TadD
MAYNNRGVIYGNSRQRELAFADYNDAIRTDPNNKYAWANRGALFASVGQRRKRKPAHTRI